MAICEKRLKKVKKYLYYVLHNSNKCIYFAFRNPTALGGWTESRGKLGTTYECSGTASCLKDVSEYPHDKGRTIINKSVRKTIGLATPYAPNA